MRQPSKEQLHILRHMLGINTPEKAKPESYRNFYCGEPGCSEMIDLNAIGCVEFTHHIAPYSYWRCTEKGKNAAIDSFKSYRHKKSRRVYLSFLRIRDSYPDLTFKDFLTSEEFKYVRKTA